MTYDFDYDVAFSFNALDEALATQLNDLLSPRLKTFIYSERQREIAGTDGQETFSAVYGQKARLIVILFRPEWGETPWTRVERDAIKNRSLNDGWDFTTFVPTVEPVQMPPWLPKTRLYVGLSRWGIDGAAAAIEARATEMGACPRVETIAERADRFAKDAAFKQTQKQFQNSNAGVTAALQAYEDFWTEVEAHTAVLRKSRVQLRAQKARTDESLRVLSGLSPCNATCYFRPHYTNVLEDVFLTIDVYKGFPELPGFYGRVNKARKLKTARYSYQLVRPDHHAWVAIDDKARQFTPSQLADHVLRTYMDIAERTPED
jgi:hypothetical protein